MNEPNVPDATSTKVGRGLLLAVGILTVAVVGATAVFSSAIRESRPGAGWLALLIVLIAMAQSMLMTLGVVRDRRVGDTTGGLGVVVLGIVLLNLFLLYIMGTLSILPERRVDVAIDQLCGALRSSLSGAHPWRRRGSHASVLGSHHCGSPYRTTNSCCSWV